MKPTAFEYFAPDTLEEVLALLNEYGDDGKLIAGGQSLVPVMNMRQVRPKVLIDLRRVKGLDEVRLDDDARWVRIGCGARHHQIEHSIELQAWCPLLPQAAGRIGYQSIRYRGTIGGNLAQADSIGAFPVALVALDGRLSLLSAEGTRTVGIDEFSTSYNRTVLRANEMIREVLVPVLPEYAGSYFQTYKKRLGQFSLACLLEGDGCRITKARLALGGLYAKVERLEAAEALLEGQQPSRELFRAAAATVAEGAASVKNWHTSAEYKRFMVQSQVERALTVASESMEREGAR